METSIVARLGGILQTFRDRRDEPGFIMTAVVAPENRKRANARKKRAPIEAPSADSDIDGREFTGLPGAATPSYAPSIPMIAF